MEAPRCRLVGSRVEFRRVILDCVDFVVVMGASKGIVALAHGRPQSDRNWSCSLFPVVSAFHRGS